MVAQTFLSVFYKANAVPGQTGMSDLPITSPMIPLLKKEEGDINS